MTEPIFWYPGSGLPGLHLSRRVDNIYLELTNAMRATILKPGDWVVWQPRVRRNLGRVVKWSRPYVRAQVNFVGLVAEVIKPGRKGKVLVWGTP